MKRYSREVLYQEHRSGVWVKYADHKTELNEAVKAENEACALECDKIHNREPSGNMSAFWCGNIIRERIK